MKPARYSDVEEWQLIEWKWEDALNDFPSSEERREFEKNYKAEKEKKEFLDQEYEKECRENNKKMLSAEKEERALRLDYWGLKPKKDNK